MAGGVPAEGASSLWNPQIFGGGSLVDEIDPGVDANALPAFSTVIFHCGGAGARPGKDGLSATAFPSGVRTIPVEATESVAPVVFYRREFRESSGGAGRFRGGSARSLSRRRRQCLIAPFCNFEWVHNPARGREAVRLAQTAVSLRSSKPIRPKGRQTVPARDAICPALPAEVVLAIRPVTRNVSWMMYSTAQSRQMKRDTTLSPDGQGCLDLIETKRMRS